MHLQNSLWVWVIVVAVCAALTSWLLAIERAERQRGAIVASDRPDYVLEDFDLTVLDSEGAVSFAVKAPFLKRDPRDESFAIDAPEISLSDAEGGRWEIRASQALIDREASEIQLVAGVRLERFDDPKGESTTQIETDRMSYFPETDQALAPGEVEVHGRGSILRGTQLTAELGPQRLRFAAGVKARFEPQDTPSNP